MSKSTPNKDMIGKGLRSLLQNIDADYKNPAGKVEAETIQKAVATNRIPLSEAPSVGKPVILYDADSKGTVNYLNLAKEILQKNGMTKMSNADRIID